MSFAGTVAWMAPEVIRTEKCSEKVDIWSYGVVLWELLTMEIPYRDVDSTKIIYGVGNYILSLPILETFPDGFKLLLHLCWKKKPKDRPSFKNIIKHLEIASPQLEDVCEKEFLNTRTSWRTDIESHMIQNMAMNTTIHKVYEDRLRCTQILFKELKMKNQELLQREKKVAE